MARPRLNLLEARFMIFLLQAPHIELETTLIYLIFLLWLGMKILNSRLSVSFT